MTAPNFVLCDDTQLVAAVKCEQRAMNTLHKSVYTRVTVNRNDKN